MVSDFRHLLGIEDLSRGDLLTFLENSAKFIEVSERNLKKVPALRGKTIINLFLEPSTRTRASFEIAGKRLSADTINVSGSGSSVSKGETLLDTARSLQAMNPDVLVVRHQASGAAKFLARSFENFGLHTAVINAGDGMHEHPTQALLDCLALLQRFGGDFEQLSGLKVAIVGDIRHSRVARSNIWAHLKLGNEVTLVGPPTLVPPEFLDVAAFPSTGRGTCRGKITVCHRLSEGLKGVDVVMVLRMQLERQRNHFIPSLEEYSREYCVTQAVLDAVAPHALVLHPGPANRGIEITSEVLEGERCLASEQVKLGVAVRMAALFLLATGGVAVGDDSKEDQSVSQGGTNKGTSVEGAGADRSNGWEQRA